MSEWIKTNDSFRELLDKAGLRTFDDWMSVARDAERDSGRQETFALFDLECEDGFRVYLKRYRPRKPSFRLFLRPSRQRIEADSARILEAIGIPTAQVVAVGERRSFGRLTESFVATREIIGARPITELVIGSRAARTTTIKKLAQMVRKMHDGHFIDHDLHCRNILYVRGDADDIHFFFIDSPRGGLCMLDILGGKARDLASLNRDAREMAPKTDRRRFIKAYLSSEELTQSDRRLCRKIEARTRPRDSEEMT